MKIEYIKVTDLDETALLELFESKDEAGTFLGDIRSLSDEEAALLFAGSKKN